MFFNANHEQMAAGADKILAAQKAAADKAKSKASSKPKYEKGKLYFGVYKDGAVCIDSDPSLITLVADNPNLPVDETGTRFHPTFGWIKRKPPTAAMPKKEAE